MICLIGQSFVGLSSLSPMLLRLMGEKLEVVEKKITCNYLLQLPINFPSGKISLELLCSCLPCDDLIVQFPIEASRQHLKTIVSIPFIALLLYLISKDFKTPREL